MCALAVETVRETELAAQSAVDRRATLMVADGRCFEGQGVGPAGIVGGELVLTTAMTGYQEALTDPSYRGQLLLFTYPLIGNYGVAAARAQSSHVQPTAVITATLSPSWSDRPSLRSYLTDRGVPVLHDIDTRALARWIRDNGDCAAAIELHDGEADRDGLRDRIDGCRYDGCRYDSDNLIAGVTVTRPEIHGHGSRTVALLDCGNKRSVVDELVERETRVIVLPASTPPGEIARLGVDGLIVSNGPGNPAVASAIVQTLRALYDRMPMFGICLGHQLLALAAGARTYKLKFGHRGANHPVQDVSSGRAFITTQNHGFAVDPATLPDDLTVSHRNLNDGTVEGLRHRTLPIRTVQFHPEGAPGPRDSGVVMDEWLGMLGEKAR